MKIGVEVWLQGDAGELFADARALESAGAESLWVMAREGQDPWTLAAALSAVTWRPRIVVVAPDRADARVTLEQLARGRLVVVDKATGDIVIHDADGQPERWSRTAFPAGRAEWKKLRAEREAEGVSGLILPNDSRLLDLLRNPDVEDDRPDLKLAFG
jgi:alkanesulfonate monooxygenase SsuD/methylene tetrahydromethanopterin reductase-like flavin-dependent oxidoreductase (luciferase family)